MIRKIQVNSKERDSVEVLAIIEGGLAVHRTPQTMPCSRPSDRDACWSITHVKTGMALMFWNEPNRVMSMLRELQPVQYLFDRITVDRNAAGDPVPVQDEHYRAAESAFFKASEQCRGGIH